MEPSEIFQHQSGDLLSRLLNDAGVLSNSFGTLLRRLTREVALVIGAITMLCVLEWRLALTLALLVPTTGWLLRRFGRTIHALSRRGQEATGEVGALLNEQLQGFTTIKLFLAEAAESARFAERSAIIREQQLASERYAGLLTASVFLLTALAFLGLGLLGSRLLSTGVINQANLLAFGLYAAQIIEPLRRLSELQGPFQASLAAAGRIYALIDYQSLNAAKTTLSPPHVPIPKALLRMQAVSASYRTDHPVLRDLTLSITAGEFVAIVGSSGAGKTTVLRLLVGFQRPTAGEIWLDECDLGKLPLSELRRRVTLVEQEPFLFSGPLVDNLKYGCPDAPRGAIEEAVHRAGLVSVIERLPKGLLTPMAEAGRQLSGGERQRLALARAILREPELLILDEATSALDSQAENQLFKQLAGWLSKRTVILVSHRLSSVLLTQRVLMLDAGQIQVAGAPSELLADSAAFRNLFASQSGLVTSDGADKTNRF
jgi:subfamily B ATP-binding cassette protein MsbA